MASQEQRDTAILRTVARMHPRLAGDEDLATALNCHVEEFARAAAGDRYAAKWRLQITDSREAVDF